MMNLARNIDGLFCVSALVGCIAVNFVPMSRAAPANVTATTPTPAHTVIVAAKREAYPREEK
jgi:hypothetical protein